MLTAQSIQIQTFRGTSNIHVTVSQRLKALTQKSILTIRQI